MKKEKWLALIMSLLIVMIMAFSSCKKSTGVESGSLSGESNTDSAQSGDTDSNIQSEETSDDGGLIKPPPASSDTTKSGSGQNVSAQSGSSKGTSNKDPYANIPASLKGKQVKILLWYTPIKSEIAVMDDFKKKTGIDYKFTSTGGTDLYTTKLSSMIASGDSPDVVTMFSFAYPVLITKNLVQTIDAGKFDLSDPVWDKEQMDIFAWNNKYYGINIKGNFHADPYCVYYNKDIFASKGVKTPEQLRKEGNWNWDTMLKAAQDLTYETGGKKVWGYTSAKTYQFMLANNTDFVTFKDGKITNNLNDSKVLSGWQFLADTIHKYKVNPGWKDSAFFTSGQCAMYAEISYGMQKGSFLEGMKDGWSAVPFPGPKGADYVLPADAKVFSLAKGAKNPEAAAYFLRYWLDPANMDIAGSLIQKENKEVFDLLSNSKKKVMMSKGVISFSNEFNDVTNALYNHSSDQTKSVLDSINGMVNTSIKNVLNEMPK